MSLNSDFESCEVDYDSEIDGIIDFDDSTDDEQEWDSESECENGPDLRDPGGSSSTLVLSSTSSSMISLPIRPNPIPEGWTPPIITPQAVDIATSTTPLASTLPKGKKQNSVGARVAALSLFDCGFEMDKITLRTGVSLSSVYKVRKKALERGWNVGENVETWHVDDAPRSGRPQIADKVKKRIIEVVCKNSTTRGWSCARIAQEVGKTPGFTEKETPSPSTVYRHLRAEGYMVCKRTIKPGLNKDQKKARLDWCLAHKDWTLEDWKNVIFTDETSVQKGGVRGRWRVWRLPKETHHPHVITRRWKGFSEFMWWSAFSYDCKGPYHIWEKETKEEKAACKKDIELRNFARFLSDKHDWEEAWDKKQARKIREKEEQIKEN
jgi:hypothetical protein